MCYTAVDNIRSRDQIKVDIITYPNIQKVGKISVGQRMGEDFMAMKHGAGFNLRFLPLLVKRKQG